jgi:hypothetical protein
LNEDDQQRLLRLALTEDQKQQAEQTVEAARRRPAALAINSAGDPNIQIIIGQFSYETVDVAEREILQYPRGTAFLRQELAPDSSEAKKVGGKTGRIFGGERNEAEA